MDRQRMRRKSKLTPAVDLYIIRIEYELALNGQREGVQDHEKSIAKTERRGSCRR